jgi:hypothetical protein
MFLMADLKPFIIELKQRMQNSQIMGRKKIRCFIGWK